MTQNFWTNYWWWWLFGVLLTWFAAEMLSIYEARRIKLPGDAWTLSDTIRRWIAKYRWLGPLIAGVTAMLLWHFIGQQNLS